MLPHECINSSIPILQFEEGEQLVIGYALPPFVDMVLDVRGANNRILAPNDRTVAEIYCERETSQLFFEPYVNTTRIVMDYEEVTSTKRIKISPGTLLTFGKEPFETSFIVTANECVAGGSEYQVGSTDNPIPMPSPFEENGTPKVMKKKLKKKIGGGGVAGGGTAEKKEVVQGVGLKPKVTCRSCPGAEVAEKKPLVPKKKSALLGEKKGKKGGGPTVRT